LERFVVKGQEADSCFRVQRLWIEATGTCLHNPAEDSQTGAGKLNILEEKLRHTTSPSAEIGIVNACMH